MSATRMAAVVGGAWGWSLGVGFGGGAWGDWVIWAAAASSSKNKCTAKAEALGVGVLAGQPQLGKQGELSII